MNRWSCHIGYVGTWNASDTNAITIFEEAFWCKWGTNDIIIVQVDEFEINLWKGEENKWGHGADRNRKEKHEMFWLHHKNYEVPEWNRHLRRKVWLNNLFKPAWAPNVSFLPVISSYIYRFF